MLSISQNRLSYIGILGSELLTMSLESEFWQVSQEKCYAYKFELLRATDVKGGPTRQHDDNRGPNKQ